jgi:hypothetical protein
MKNNYKFILEWEGSIGENPIKDCMQLANNLTSSWESRNPYFRFEFKKNNKRIEFNKLQNIWNN